MGYATRESIRVVELLAEVQGVGRGGTALFIGTVRRSPDDGPVVRIDYSAYEPMLEAEFARIVGETLARWPDVRVAARHRLGPVEVGEASIAVAAGAPHRDAAFDACRHVMEQAKRRLPVWKLETLDDGSTVWRDNDRERVTTPPPEL